MVSQRTVSVLHLPKNRLYLVYSLKSSFLVWCVCVCVCVCDQTKSSDYTRQSRQSRVLFKRKKKRHHREVLDFVVTEEEKDRNEGLVQSSMKCLSHSC